MMFRTEKGQVGIREIHHTVNVQLLQLAFRAEVCSGSYHPSDAMSWIRDLEAAQNIDDLRTSHSITRKPYSNFETLDDKIATALKKILMNTSFKKKVRLEEPNKFPISSRSKDRLHEASTFATKKSPVQLPLRHVERSP